MSNINIPLIILESVNLRVIAEPNSHWQIEELENVLVRSHQLIAEHSLKKYGRINVCLSGGLDSSLSLAIIHSLFPDVLIFAFTIGSSSTHPDILASRQVAKAFDAYHIVLTPSRAALVNALSDMRDMLGRDPISQGDLGVFTFYAFLADLGIKNVIAHDGIDELMGGYWDHVKAADMEPAFRHFWERLIPDHLEPLEEKAQAFNINVLYPYLDAEVVEYISYIPLKDRTSREYRKAPLRELARKYGVPEQTIVRPKKGFCDVLAEE